MFEDPLSLHLLEAAGIGLGTSLFLHLLRGYGSLARVRVSAVLAAILGGLALVVGDFEFSLQDGAVRLFAAGSLLAAAYAALHILDAFIWDRVNAQGRGGTVPRYLLQILNFLGMLVAAMAVLRGVYGVDLSGLVVTSTVLSAVIGLALQDMLGNAVSGLVLQVERPFGPGDWIRLAGHEGVITEMTWRTIKIQNHDSHTIILPNGLAAREQVVNFSRPGQPVGMHAFVGVHYRHPPGEVRPVLEDAARLTPGVVEEPPPHCRVVEYGDSSIQYDVLFFLSDYGRLPRIRSEVMTRIWYALRRHGMSIPFPIRDITVRTATSHDDELAAKQHLQGLREALHAVALFQPLSDAVIGELAQGAFIRSYCAGECLVRQGEEGDSLFLLQRGSVRIERRSSRGTVPLATLGPGDFFGEMSLLTGAPRAADAIAESETEVIVVDKEHFGAILRTDESVMAVLSEELARRERVRRDSADHAAVGASASSEPAPSGGQFLSRMRAFFSGGRKASTSASPPVSPDGPDPSASDESSAVSPSSKIP